MPCSGLSGKHLQNVPSWPLWKWATLFKDFCGKATSKIGCFSSKMHLISQKLLSLRGLINPVRSNFYAVGQKQSPWLAVKSYSPNPQPPHRTLAPPLPGKWTKLCKAVFRDKYRHIPPIQGLWGEGERRGWWEGMRDHEALRFGDSPVLLWPRTVGLLTKCIQETAGDSDTRNTLRLLFPVYLCLQKATTVNKLLPTTNTFLHLC